MDETGAHYTEWSKPDRSLFKAFDEESCTLLHFGLDRSTGVTCHWHIGLAKVQLSDSKPIKGASV